MSKGVLRWLRCIARHAPPSFGSLLFPRNSHHPTTRVTRALGLVLLAALIDAAQSLVKTLLYPPECLGRQIAGNKSEFRADLGHQLVVA